MQGHLLSFFRGLAVTFTGVGVTINQILTHGSLLLTLVGAILAVAGGWWTYRTQRLKHRIAETELKKAELDLARFEREKP